TVDALNALVQQCGRHSFSSMLDGALFEALLRLNAVTMPRPELLKAVDDPASLPGGTVRHAIRFAKSLSGILKDSSVLKEYAEQKAGGELSRLSPSAGSVSLRSSVFPRATPKGLAMEIAVRFEQADPFAHDRSFRYKKGEFFPVELKSIRPLGEFFGYAEAKRVFQEHFSGFLEGRHNLPLLISGLPGLGKTQMTIAYALSHPETTLILPEPDSLQNGLENLIEKLAGAPGHKFIVFFDDIDTREMNWYYFRTHVGGSFALPRNIMTVIASNYRFPPNISSRGRAFTFPFFDEIRCQEMIEDMFLSRGMKHVSPELLSLIAADYVESFGQKLFDELSPRTLARYLELYLSDREKRRLMLELSHGDVITKPDPQAFYAQNMGLLRALYGKEAIDEIREKELSGK
ncbi:MAG: DUF815 domain-containing protein, partial [Lentisphaeria bacterium]|nr:DUF815 domain-containing protein [Lentisphaeria bacterium]